MYIYTNVYLYDNKYTFIKYHICLKLYGIIFIWILYHNIFIKNS